MTSRRRIGVVGAGYMAEEHIRAFLANGGVDVVGITSRTQESAEALAARYGVPNVYGSISELFDATHADAVVVAVNELSTRSAALEAFRFPWLVLIEKPAGYTYDEAALIAHESSERAFVALNRRFYESTRCLVDALDVDTDSRFVVIEDQEDIEAAKSAGRPQSVIDNWMYANSIHLVDLFGVFCRGRVGDVEVHDEWVPGHPTVVTASISFTSGDRGLYISRWNRPGPWSVSVTTTRARRVMAPLEDLGEQKRGEFRLRPVALTTYGKIKPGLARLCTEVLHAIDGKPHSLPTVLESLESMDLVRKIYFPIP